MPVIRLVAVLLLLPSIGRSEDWPQWLGPRRDATSSEKVEPWKTAPRVLWRCPVGEGHSSPVVAGGRVFLHSKVRDKELEEVTCFDSASGKPIWQTSYAKQPFTTPFGNGPRATPCVHGDRVYTLGITGILTCLDAGTGRTDWQIDLLKEFKAQNLGFGVSCSPLVAEGKVFVNVGGPAASIVALETSQPKVVWKALSDPASYSSAILFGTGPERQIVFLSQQGVVSLDPGNGKLNWKFPLVDLLSESSTTPVKLGDMLLASSVTYGSVGLKLGMADGKPSAGQAWKNSALTCYFSTPVAVDAGRLR